MDSIWFWIGVWALFGAIFASWLRTSRRKAREQGDAERLRQHLRSLNVRSLQDIDRGRPNPNRTVPISAQARLAARAREERAFQRLRNGEPAVHEPTMDMPVVFGFDSAAPGHRPADSSTSFFESGHSGGGGAEGSWSDSGSTDSGSSGSDGGGDGGGSD